MKRSAYFANVARGGCVDEPALVKGLEERRIAGAALERDRARAARGEFSVVGNGQVLITPHTAGETRKYEDNVLDILVENLDRLWSGAPSLRNEIV
jgi:phosphoglycerate dehydrogenase-like enzyme